MNSVNKNRDGPTVLIHVWIWDVIDGMLNISSFSRSFVYCLSLPWEPNLFTDVKKSFKKVKINPSATNSFVLQISTA